MKKDLLVVAFVLFIVGWLVTGTKIQSVEEYYLTHIDEITEDSETVTLEIRSDTVLDSMDKLKPGLEKYVEPDGEILKKTEYVLRSGDTAFDLLDRATRHHRIPMEYQGADYNIYNSIYVQGINYLYEFNCGPLSGWMYKVNGEFPSRGVSQYELQDGDEVEFHYTCDLGRDLDGYIRQSKKVGN